MQHLTSCILTPAPRGSRAGNRATAERWAALLRDAGLRIRVSSRRPAADTDLLIALHAWRSAEAVQSFRRRHPGRPLIVVLTGTDLYRFQYSDPEPTLASMAAADALIGLHDLVAEAVPQPFRDKLHIVHQSATDHGRRPTADPERFEACVLGHLREEKDPLRAAEAVRDLPADSRLHITQAGKAHSPDWAEQARREMSDNPRYRWCGELDRTATGQLLGRSRLMVISSRMEGGANVVSEACVAGTPVIASDIPGNRGLLGDTYAGYFPPADSAALRALLLRAEAEPAFLAALAMQVRERAALFSPRREQQGLLHVIRTVMEARHA